MNKYYITFFSLLIFFLININSSGQISFGDEANNSLTMIGMSPADISKLENKTTDLLKDLLNNSETLNFALDETLGRFNKSNILKGLDLKFNTFEVDSVSILGLTYSYSKNIQTNYFEVTEAHKNGLDFALNMNGIISLNKKYNPNNFLKSSISFSYFNSSGGVDKFSEELTKEFRILRDSIVNIDDQDSLDNSPLWDEFVTKIVGNLNLQLFLQVGLTAALEANQNFTSKNYAYSLNIGLDLKEWNPKATLSFLNIFDWPFAITRWLSGTEKNIFPRGATIPTVLLNLSYVDPSADPQRKTLNETKGYSRFSIESGFRTLVCNISNNPLYFSANLRYFKEINPSSQIKNLKLHESLYFVAALTHQDGMFVSYATGKLPYDQKNDEVYSIGFNYNF